MQTQADRFITRTRDSPGADTRSFQMAAETRAFRTDADAAMDPPTVGGATAGAGSRTGPTL
jgi:hypothetical protein